MGCHHSQGSQHGLNASKLPTSCNRLQPQGRPCGAVCTAKVWNPPEPDLPRLLCRPQPGRSARPAGCTRCPDRVQAGVSPALGQLLHPGKPTCGQSGICGHLPEVRLGMLHCLSKECCGLADCKVALHVMVLPPSPLPLLGSQTRHLHQTCPAQATVLPAGRDTCIVNMLL